MSKKLTNRDSQFEILDKQIRGTSYSAYGQLLSKTDQGRVQDALIMCSRLLWGIISSHSVVDPRDLQQWFSAVAARPLEASLDCLKKAGELLVEVVENSLDVHTYADFKRQLSSKFPSCGQLIGPIAIEVVGALDGNPEAFAACLSYFWFLKKLHFQSDFLAEKALQDYLDVERSLTAPGSLIEADLVKQWFPKRDISLICEHSHPHHGDGSVSEREAGTDVILKYHCLTRDSRIDYLGIQFGFSVFDNGRQLDRCSRTNFVPKSYSSYRTVSSEPATLMWYQEGINDGLNWYIQQGRHPLSRRFRREDQVPNRLLAQEGSMLLNESYATIDLSHASDSISLELFKAWFIDSAIYPLAFLVRSDRTLLPTGEVIPLRKWAPMGTALTFTIEVIVFAAITETAIRKCGGNPDQSRYRVYGDDIVVERQYYDAVVSELILNGFTPNEEKSFKGMGPLRFRESCGGFYLNGYDVTPVMISRKFPGYGGAITTWIDSAKDLANRALSYSFAKELRRWIVQRILKIPPALQPCFSEHGRIGIKSNTASNFRLAHRYDENLQEEVIVHGGPQLVTGDYPEEEGDWLLYEWLRLAEERGKRPILSDEDVIRAPRRVPGRGNEKRPGRRGVAWVSGKTTIAAFLSGD